MARSRYTRRRLLSMVATFGAVGGSLAGTTARSTATSSYPTLTPGTTAQLSDKTIGWAAGTATASAIDTEQSIDQDDNRAVIDAVAPVDCSGSFSQTALVGMPFSITGCSSPVVSATVSGRVSGVLQAGKNASVTVEIRSGIGTREALRPAVLTPDSAPSIDSATLTEQTVHATEAIDSTLSVSHDGFDSDLSGETPADTVLVLYLALITTGQVDSFDTATVDFGPAGQQLSTTRPSGLTIDSGTLTVHY